MNNSSADMRNRRLVPLMLLFLLSAWTGASAYNVNWTGPDLGDWNTNANWTTPSGSHFVPDQGFPPGEAAAFDNNTTARLAAPALFHVGGIKLGLTSGNFGGLRVDSGGNVTSRIPDSGATEENGAIQVGVGGQGILTVLGGGTVSGTSLTLAGASNSMLTLGGTTASTAALSLSGAANLQRITTVIGPNVNFNAAGNLSLANTSTLVADIRNATNHSALKTDGNATVGGTLRPMFTGFTPAAGNRWRLIDAVGNVNQDFSAIDTSLVSLPQGLALRTLPGMNGTRNTLDLLVEEVLVLQVNRDTGAVTMANVGAASKTIDGYSILSPHGSLTGTWNSLQDQAVAGWVEAAPTANALSELNPGSTPPGSLAINAGQSRSLGTPYAKTFPAFGVDPDDIKFEYSGPDGRTLQGQVVYSGTKVLNNLVLTVDPTTGQAALKNDSPFTIQVDGYSVYSTSGSLLPANGSWNSLQDQNVAGWEEASPTASALAELKANGTLTLQPGTGYGLGGLFKTAGATQDLRLEFLQAGNDLPSLGAVVYGPVTLPPPPGGGLPGDYNNNNVVDAADYALWRNSVGQAITLPNDTTPSSVTQADYDVWRANFGKTPAASGAGAVVGAAVPEPASFMLLLVAALGPIATRRGARRA